MSDPAHDSQAAGEALEQLLRKEIPLTLAIDLRVESYDRECLILCAPIGPNLNHKRTAFGGSLYSLAVLAGWGMLWLKLREAGETGHIVVQQSSVDYREPVAGDLRARVDTESMGNLDRFLETYCRRGRARIRVEVGIEGAKGRAMDFHGRYVVHR
jgi:thioesterase domain-containing protein